MANGKPKATTKAQKKPRRESITLTATQDDSTTGTTGTITEPLELTYTASTAGAPVTITIGKNIPWDRAINPPKSDSLRIVIAMSNNAWFTPSIEPTLQKLLMRFYARKNGVTIYHSANYKGTGIIK